MKLREYRIGVDVTTTLILNNVDSKTKTALTTPTRISMNISMCFKLYDEMSITPSYCGGYKTNLMKAVKIVEVAIVVGLISVKTLNANTSIVLILKRRRH